MQPPPQQHAAVVRDAGLLGSSPFGSASLVPSPMPTGPVVRATLDGFCHWPIRIPPTSDMMAWQETFSGGRPAGRLAEGPAKAIQVDSYANQWPCKSRFIRMAPAANRGGFGGGASPGGPLVAPCLGEGKGENSYPGGNGNLRVSNQLGHAPVGAHTLQVQNLHSQAPPSQGGPLRPQGPPPHSASGVPTASTVLQTASHHLSHGHTGGQQHAHHALMQGGVTGPAGPAVMGSQVGHTGVVGTGGSPSPAGPPELTPQGMPQGPSQQLQQGAVPIHAGVHSNSMIFSAHAAGLQPNGQGQYIYTPTQAMMQQGTTRPMGQIPLPAHMGYYASSQPQSYMYAHITGAHYPSLAHHRSTAQQAQASYSAAQMSHTPQGYHQYQLPVYSSPHMPAASVPRPREKKPLPVVDPDTGLNVLETLENENLNEKGPSPSKTPDSSARNTPALMGQPTSEAAKIIEQFSTQVANSLASDRPSNELVTTERTLEPGLPDASVGSSEQRMVDKPSVECTKSDSVPSTVSDSTKYVPGRSVSVGKLSGQQQPVGDVHVSNRQASASPQQPSQPQMQYTSSLQSAEQPSVVHRVAEVPATRGQESVDVTSSEYIQSKTCVGSLPASQISLVPPQSQGKLQKQISPSPGGVPEDIISSEGEQPPPADKQQIQTSAPTEQTKYVLGQGQAQSIQEQTKYVLSQGQSIQKQLNRSQVSQKQGSSQGCVPEGAQTPAGPHQKFSGSQPGQVQQQRKVSNTQPPPRLSKSSLQQPAGTTPSEELTVLSGGSVKSSQSGPPVKGQQQPASAPVQKTHFQTPAPPKMQQPKQALQPSQAPKVQAGQPTTKGTSQSPVSKTTTEQIQNKQIVSSQAPQPLRKSPSGEDAAAQVKRQEQKEESLALTLLDASMPEEKPNSENKLLCGTPVVPESSSSPPPPPLSKKEIAVMPQSLPLQSSSPVRPDLGSQRSSSPAGGPGLEGARSGSRTRKRNSKSPSPALLEASEDSVSRPPAQSCLGVSDISTKFQEKHQPVPVPEVSKEAVQDTTNKAPAVGPSVEPKKDVTPEPSQVSGFQPVHWTPENPDGKKVYDRQFLMNLRNNPLSQQKPDLLPDLEIVLDEPLSLTNDISHRYSTDFTPGFVQSQQQSKNRGAPYNQPRMGLRGSQQKNQRLVPKVIEIKSLNTEVKLKTAENAWKPSTMKAQDNVDEEKRKLDEVTKKMRGILNKLTPENFERLAGRVQAMNIENDEQFQSIIDLIFEKAVDEQAFSATYAMLCQVLQNMSLKNEEGNKNNKDKFRKLILQKCQREFESDNTELINKEKKMKEIAMEKDPEKKMELEAVLEYEETKYRKRSVGNIRFIGELFKLSMIKPTIMFTIIEKCLGSKDEESLECLCKLLTTIGKIIEGVPANNRGFPTKSLDSFFVTMQNIVDSKETSSRVRFLMMDVIEMRENGWKPRREDNKPKTKAEVHEEVKREEYEQQMALSSAPSRPRDDKDRRKRDRDRDSKMDCEWSTVCSSKSSSAESSRLKNVINRTQSQQCDLKFGGQSSFITWATGSSFSRQNEKMEENNRFQVLDSCASMDRRPGVPNIGPRLASTRSGEPRHMGYGSKSMTLPTEKDSLLSDVARHQGGSGERSKSTSRPESRESSQSRESAERSSLKVQSGFQVKSQESLFKGRPSIEDSVANKFTLATVQEYISSLDIEEAKNCLTEKFSPATVHLFVLSAFQWVVDKNSTKRTACGNLFHAFIKDNLINCEQFVNGTKDMLEMTSDYLIDIPDFCVYVGEVLAPCLMDGGLSLKCMLDITSAAEGKQSEIFANILLKASTLMNPSVLVDMWHSSGLLWSDIIHTSDYKAVQDFLCQKELIFMQETAVSESKSSGSLDSSRASSELAVFEKNLYSMFTGGTINDKIIGWIDSNCTSELHNPKLVRALVTALVESAVKISTDGSFLSMDVNIEDIIKGRSPILQKYVANRSAWEMQCIYALQALSVKYEHPLGLLDKCFTALHAEEIVADDTFYEWEKEDCPQEAAGKGVCILSLNQFFNWLRYEEPEGDAEVDEADAPA